MLILKYILRRTLGTIPLLFFTSVTIFFLAYMMPFHGMGKDFDIIIVSKLYFDWITDFLSGDFGYSYYYRADTTYIIKQKLQNTLVLGVASLLISYILSYFMGRYAGRRPNTVGDHLIAGLNYTGLSVPLIIVSVYSIFLFSFELGWFPSNGSVDITVPEGTLAYWIDKLHHLVLPATVLGIVSTATYTQFLRDGIIENSRKDYVRTARAKGTSEKNIYNKHILRNSMIPLITFIGFDFVNIVNGAIIVETVFTYPGIGQLFIRAIEVGDFAILINLTLMFSFFTIIGNMFADIMYGIVDPRIMLE
ncbi:ABC transporter permease [Pseudoneobacillus sp. C159]